MVPRPAPDERSLLNLRADFAINDAAGADKWAPRDLLGDYGFEPWHTFDATAILENSKLLAATPHWMRNGDHTHLIGSPMDRAGVEVPHPAPAKPHLTKGRPLAPRSATAGTRSSHSGCASTGEPTDSL